MTELGHGSNVAALQTECVLDTTTDEWIVNTPDDSAIKWCASPYSVTYQATVCARLRVATMLRLLCSRVIYITQFYELPFLCSAAMYVIHVCGHVANIDIRRIIKQYAIGRRLLVMYVLLTYKVSTRQADNCSADEVPHLTVQQVGAV